MHLILKSNNFSEETAYCRRLIEVQIILWTRDFPFGILYRQIVVFLSYIGFELLQIIFISSSNILIQGPSVMVTPKYFFFLTARRTDSINIATGMWASFSWTRGSINSLLIQMGNKYFGQQHSHSRDIPHHVRRCFVGISDPLLGSYFHGRILHRILFKSSWSPDTRYPTWSTCCSPAVPISASPPTLGIPKFNASKWPNCSLQAIF